MVVWTSDDLPTALQRLPTVPGALGLARNKAGRIGYRIAEGNIAVARGLLCPDRIMDTNAGVIPRVHFDTVGWPPGTGAQDAVRVLHAAGWEVLPLRSSGSDGQIVWTVAAEAACPKEQIHTSHGVILVVPSRPRGKPLLCGMPRPARSQPPPGPPRNDRQGTKHLVQARSEKAVPRVPAARSAPCEPPPVQAQFDATNQLQAFEARFQQREARFVKHEQASNARSQQLEARVSKQEQVTAELRGEARTGFARMDSGFADILRAIQRPSSRERETADSAEGRDAKQARTS